MSFGPSNVHNSPRKPIGRGEPLLANEPKTLAELFLLSHEIHRRPDMLRFKSDGMWQSISSEEFIRRAENIGLGLYSLGLRRSDRAAILAANCPKWTLSDAGCQFAGIIDVPIYTTLSAKSVAYVLRDSGTRVLFIEHYEQYERIRAELADCTNVENVVFFDEDIPAGVDAITLSQLEALGGSLRDQEPHLTEQLYHAVKPEDVATLIYTSGTTGEPKGVMLSQNNLISNVIDAGAKYAFAQNDVSLSVLPLSHVFERTAMYLYLFNGMSVNYAESVDKVPENLLEVRPTIFVGVPRIFEKVYARAKLKAAQSGGLKEKIFDWAIEIAKETAMFKERGRALPVTLSLKHKIADAFVFSKMRAFFGGRLRYCITGGAALSDEIFLIFTGAGISIMQGYGLTETSPVISSNNPSGIRLGTVGRPIRNVSVRIAEDGEVEATGPGVMYGYYNKPEATFDVFTEDGWFKTGDIGQIDPDGFLKITDRKKELFKTSGGKYIAPSPIEQMIRGSRFVSQVVLVGDGRKFATALIVPNFEMLESYAKHKGMDIKTPTEFCSNEKIIDLFERQIAGHTHGLSQFETVKRFRLLENELTVEGGELTPTLKVKRRVVDEKYKDLIDGMYSD